VLTLCLACAWQDKGGEGGGSGEGEESWSKRATLFKANHRLAANKTVAFQYDKVAWCWVVKARPGWQVNSQLELRCAGALCCRTCW
jgi:hypothetical protein